VVFQATPSRKWRYLEEEDAPEGEMIDEIEEDARDEETSRSGLIAAAVIGLVVGAPRIWCVGNIFDNGEEDSVYVNLAGHTDSLRLSLMSKVVRVWQA